MTPIAKPVYANLYKENAVELYESNHPCIVFNECQRQKELQTALSVVKDSSIAS